MDRHVRRLALLNVLPAMSLCLALTTATAPAAVLADTVQPEITELADMGLEKLMQLEITTGTLTRIDRKLVPSAITYIDRDMIDQANPRSLIELLDIYVPNLHWEMHQWEPAHVGIRGIISDREDKYLLLVNNRVMNERTHFGALTERDQVLLGDLQQVDVIRGPGSAVYGPGAVSGVVALQTYSGLTYEGTGIAARGGVYEEFYSLEFKHGGKSDDKTGYFFYLGAAKYNGADHDYSPLTQGHDFTTSYGQFEHGEPVPYPTIDNNRSYRDNPQLKLHAQFDADGLTMWTRYTYGGQQLTIDERGYWANWPVGWAETLPRPEFGYGYQQLTAFAGYKKPLNDQFDIDVSTSVDATEYERVLADAMIESYTEYKSISKALLHWTPNDSHQVAGGVEYGYYWLGNDSWRTPDAPQRLGKFGPDTPRWQANMVSFVGEHQWHINNHWTTILGARADKHVFTDWMFSPRAAIAFAPNDKDTFKFIASRSLRTNFEEEMKAQDMIDGEHSEPEEMQTLELRYERQQNENLFFAGSVFYNDIDVLGWDGAANSGNGGYATLGSYKSYGAEAELSYRTGDTSFTLSHSYTKLCQIELEEGVSSIISAAALDVGDDLANWPQHLSKFTVHRQFDRKWSGDASVRVEWNFPGDKDFLKYRNDNPFYGPGGEPSSVEGWDDPYGPSVFLNLGVQHRFDEHATVRVDAYNVLGWFDEQLNKRGFLGGIWEGQYRSEAPAVGVAFNYEF